MDIKLKKRIYDAQCIGNVEPIEYMIPYPSMRSLIEGQNIKYGNQLIIKNDNITNSKYHQLIQQTAHWLTHKGLKPKDRIVLPKLPKYQSEILLFSIWQIGATVVLSREPLSKKYQNDFKIKEINFNKKDILSNIISFPKIYNPKHKPLLSEEALITFENGSGIQLSHYNLLINTSGVLKLINKKGRIRYSCEVDFHTSGWVILKAILPIYAGYIYDDNNSDLTIAKSNADFNIRYDLNNLDIFNNNDIAMCPQNSGIISVGRNPVHLTQLSRTKSKLILKGHSVMMGYLDQKLNEKSFKEKSLIVAI
jgi:hypothetical protein